MIHWQAGLQRVVRWCWDPVTRERVALQRAERKGMAQMMEPLRRALAEADALGIQLYGSQLEQYLQVLKTVAPTLAAPTLAALPPAPPAVTTPLGTLPRPPLAFSLPTYLVSPATLAEAYAQLVRPQPGNREEPEWMLAVTGVKQDNLYTLERLIEVKLANQSALAAAFDMQDFARIAVTLYEQGLALHAIFHSHRFSGPPQPSGVDWKLQDMLDQGGYPAIQAVFSEDGYVRFFARRPFTVTIAGKGVECVDQKEGVYRIVHFGTLPHPGDSARPSGDAARPLPAHSRS
jgi:proteasome lid subunit RPN8/RPN11